MKSFLAKSIFYLRFKFVSKKINALNVLKFKVLGMHIGKNTRIGRIRVIWPHQIQIGSNCKLEHNIFLKFDGIYCPGPNIKICNNVFIGAGCEFNISNSITIGNDCLIASGCKFIDHNHGTDSKDLMRVQKCPSNPIIIENNVWIGVDSKILMGVHIATGAIVGAGSVVNKSIPANEIWAGVPAKKIGERT